MRQSLLFLVPILTAGAAACTTLGPTPGTTAISARPAARPDVEAQAAIVPGHYLSDAVVSDPGGNALRQLSVMVEPGHVVDVPGLIVGARAFGFEEGDTPIEPMIGLRRTIDAEGQVAVGAVAYGTRTHAARDGASYRATRLGVEGMTDVRLMRENRWLEVHLFATASVTSLSVEGSYCVDGAGRYGVDCPDPPDQPTVVTSHAGGLYAGANAGLAVELFRHRAGPFHGGRLAIMFGGGTMPRVVSGEQVADRSYTSAGLSLSLALGNSE